MNVCSFVDFETEYQFLVCVIIRRFTKSKIRLLSVRFTDGDFMQILFGEPER